ncbi:MAG: hypothetical protein ACOX6J_03600 [Oscillospiraceae bacterium]|jgi:hypothetical protein
MGVFRKETISKSDLEKKTQEKQMKIIVWIFVGLLALFLIYVILCLVTGTPLT